MLEPTTSKIKTTKTRKHATTTRSATSIISTTTSTQPSVTPSLGPLPPTGEYRIGVVLYPGWTVLDVFGPLEAFNQLSLQ